MIYGGLKRFLTRYLNSWAVLGIDVLVSTSASAIAIGIVSLWQRQLFTSATLPIVWLLSATLAALAGFLGLRTYRNVIRHTTLHEVGHLMTSIVIKEALLVVLIHTLPWEKGLIALGLPMIALLFILDFSLTAIGLILLRISMLMVYDFLRRGFRKTYCGCKRVLVFGDDNKSVSLVKRLSQSPHYNVLGFISRGEASSAHTIAGMAVYLFSDGDDLEALRRRLKLDGVLFATEDNARSERSGLVEICTERNLKVLVAPAIDEVVGGRIMKGAVREVRIEDLLGRREISISMNEVMAGFKNRTVLVTGAAGSIGSELCRQLAGFGIKKLILLDNAETPVHNIRLELEERFPKLDFVPLIGDVRIASRLDFVFRTHRPQIVFHAAAYKHVPLMEENPCEAVLANVAGTRNVADKCIEYGVDKMVMISTDKAVNPTNIMGCTKRMAEIYVQSLGVAIKNGEVAGRTKFVTTRFGNVLGSNGSVIPRFREQIAKGGPVTVTHPEITRFFMTIPEACRLVMEAATMTSGNDIFVFDMGESVKIVDLARRMIELAGLIPGRDIQIEFTGLRPGEKLYEEVLSNSENTIPTQHSRIRIAKVREYSYTEALDFVNTLETLSRSVDIPATVCTLKRAVPEFISRNSEFERFDRHTGSGINRGG